MINIHDVTQEKMKEHNPNIIDPKLQIIYTGYQQLDALNLEKQIH